MSAIRSLLLIMMTGATAVAAEYHGSVTARGLPFVGATVSASRDGHTQVALTDAHGVFSFANLADGVWTIEVAMLGFEKLKREVAVAAGAPAPTFDLHFLTET